MRSLCLCGYKSLVCVTQIRIDTHIRVILMNSYRYRRLESCGFGEKGCTALVSALKSNPSQLRELNLNFNQIGDSGVKLICALLGNQHCKLEKLQ